MAEEVAGYEGESGVYTENNDVTKFQNALIKLGYTLPKFGVDGKFGPETQSQLTKFQEENKLTSSVGKMDRYTAKKMAEILKSKNIPDSETLQSELGEI
jgi:peptidoglycan hydrolase-like protein with peptidoglycan-binding domain